MIRTPDVGCLDGGEIHVWFAGTAVSGDECQALLSLDERERADRFRFARDRASFVARRGVLRLLLGRYLDHDPMALALATTRSGRPVLAWPASDVAFSVTHTTAITAWAFCRDVTVGVDVEQIRPTIEPSLVARVCTARERAALADVPSEARPAGFFTLWTHKEALVKADGRGLSVPVDRIDVADALAHEVITTRLPDGGDDTAYFSQRLAIHRDVAAAIASPAHDRKVRTRHLTL